MRRCWLSGALVLVCGWASAVREEPVQVLWPQGAPGAQGTEEKDIPAMTPFLPEGAQAEGSGTPAIIVCPGGGYAGLAMGYEGFDVARWLAENGIAGFVLRYRLGPAYHHPAPLQDALRAIRTVRHRAKEWNIDPKRVGILGFSAGGHLTGSAATLFHLDIPTAGDEIDAEPARPDFACPVYPVICMGEPYGHPSCLMHLLGDAPAPELIELVSLEKQVRADTAPCFIVHSLEDQVIPVENALLFFSALRKAGVTAELHVFQRGRHGLGMGSGDPAFAAWPGLFLEWLRTQGVLPAAVKP
ncbi:MAG: alpha/beta hydrolase [Candidatus Hydrogenedentes bacterium]|nr:alpha/beta hydrolase [Candidatus Hydrogenedentota bacterium]